MEKYTWEFEATEYEVETLLKICSKNNLHDLGFWKKISEAINCPKCGMVIKSG